MLCIRYLDRRVNKKYRRKVLTSWHVLGQEASLRIGQSHFLCPCHGSWKVREAENSSSLCYCTFWFSLTRNSVSPPLSDFTSLPSLTPCSFSPHLLVPLTQLPWEPPPTHVSKWQLLCPLTLLVWGTVMRVVTLRASEATVSAHAGAHSVCKQLGWPCDSWRKRKSKHSR